MRFSGWHLLVLLFVAVAVVAAVPNTFLADMPKTFWPIEVFDFWARFWVLAFAAHFGARQLHENAFIIVANCNV